MEAREVESLTDSPSDHGQNPEGLLGLDDVVREQVRDLRDLSSNQHR